jgi:hypothetical protein
MKKRFNLDESDKLSQAIVTLACPYKEQFNTYPAYQTLITLTCSAWNAELLREPKRSEMIGRVIDLCKDITDEKGLLEFRELIDALIKRKQILFPDDIRYITKFEVVEGEDNDPAFVVVVTDAS